MTMTAPAADVDATAAVGLFRSLGDPTRLAIVQHLALGEHRVVDLTAHLGLAQSTVSQHLSCLRECGLLDARAEGRATVYSLARPELLDLLGAAERLLEATGRAVALCPTSGGATSADGPTSRRPTAGDPTSGRRTPGGRSGAGA